ncbi:hypothetical protein [Lysobacter tyrosinilyticus]
MLRLLLCCVLLALAACSKPQPPEKERPVEPQSAKPDGLGNGATDMPEMIQAPVDRARKVRDDMQKEEEQRQEAIDKAEGG